MVVWGLQTLKLTLHVNSAPEVECGSLVYTSTTLLPLFCQQSSLVLVCAKSFPGRDDHSYSTFLRDTRVVFLHRDWKQSNTKYAIHPPGSRDQHDARGILSVKTELCNWL